MKLLTIFFFVTLTSAFSSYSQHVMFNLELKDAALIDVFQQIEENSEFIFLFNERTLDINRKVSVKVKDERVESLLAQIFDKTDNTYKIYDRQIVILTKNEKDLPNEIITPEPQPQKKDINGNVKDQNGTPLMGVSVAVKGTTLGAITDLAGNFTIQVPLDVKILVFSFVGMKSQEITIEGRTIFDLVMEEEKLGMEEVVVVGYGTMKKSDLTGSISQIKSKEIQAFPNTNVLQSMTGRVTGVEVKQNTGAPGTPISIRIRGINSIQGSNEPLYIIDGFPTNNLSAINSSDVESIEVLKDASSTAIYGSRGANGVVLITTKGPKVGKTQIDFDANYGIQTLRKKMDLMNATEYATFTNQIRVNDGLEPYFTQSEIDNFGEGFDWQDELFQAAPMITTSISINGGNDNTNYYLGGSLLKQDGIMKTTYYDRYSLNTKFNQKITDKLRINFSSKLSYTETDGIQPRGGNRGNGIVSGTLSAPPTLTPYNDDGTYNYLLIAYPFISNSLDNPMNILLETERTERTNFILANTDLIFQPISELTIRLSGGIDNSDQRIDNYVTNNMLRQAPTATISTRQYQSLLSEIIINFNKTFNQKHTVSTVAGISAQKFKTTNLSASGTGFLSDATETHDLSAAEIPGIPSSGYTKSAILSALTRVNYNYDNRYLATFTFRSDGASQYSEGNKWGYFPSGALAWRVNNEDFFKGVPFISNLKLRVSWGVSGSQAISAYSTLNLLSSGTTVFGNDLYIGYSPGTRLAGDLKWETTETKNVGLDLGVFDNRLNLTTDYYIKTTRDLLNTVGLPQSFGYTSTIRNVGKMQNKGFELGINAYPFTGKFMWNINCNVSMNRNKIVELYEGEDIYGASVGVNLVQDNVNVLREGEPVGCFYGYLEDGYNDNGQIQFQDLNDDEKINSFDKVIIGNPNPDFIYGFNSIMTYKKIELTFFIQGVQGNDLFNVSTINNTLDFGIGINMPRDVYLNHWTPTNTTAKYPIPKTSTNVKPSDRFVEDGSYLRLKNIELAYNFPVKKIKINNIRIFVSAQNYLTLTKYSWWDPEVNTFGGGLSDGLDHYSYPTSKKITFGFQARF